MTGQDQDTALIQAIAQRRDKRAFEALARAWSGELYSLAVYLLGPKNQSLAEDAVQETLLTLWNRAGNFDPAQGLPRVWMRHVLAHGVLKMRRRAGRQAEKIDGLRRSAGWSSEGSAPPHSVQEKSDETGEVLACLGGLLKQLPETDRQLVALYYGADFSQSEISTLLAIPQTTVSGRIARTVERLRSALEGAGFAAVFHPAEMMNAALCGGYKTPRHTIDSVLGRLALAARQRPGGAGEGALARWGLRVSALLALATGAAIWAMGGFHPQSLAGSPNPASAAVGASPAVAKVTGQEVARGGFARSWDFDQPGDYPGILRYAGDGFRRISRGGVGNSGCLESFRDNATLGLEMVGAKLPLHLGMDVRFNRGLGSGDKPADLIVGVVLTGWTRVKGLSDQSRIEVGRWVRFEFQVSRRCSAVTLNGHLLGMDLYDGSAPVLDFVGIVVKGESARIDNLELREIGPDQLAGVSPVLEAVERIPPALRTGVQPLPPFQGMLPGQHPTVHFNCIANPGGPP